MRFAQPLTGGRLLRRYKRFLADIVLDSGEEITAHVANPGAMMGLATPGARVLLSHSPSPSRKLPWSWELVEGDFGAGPEWVGVNTAHPNRIVEQAIADGFFPEFARWPRRRREARYGEASRVDILLEADDAPPCYVEIKNVHLMRTPGLAEFPDSVTSRGAKHLRELARRVQAGDSAVMIYLIQMRAERFDLAADIDKAYALAFDQAHAQGVQAIALACDVTPEGIEIARRVPIVRGR